MLMGLVFGVLVSFAALAVALVAACGGHGSYLPAKILFPYAMLITLRWSRVTTLAAALAFIQMPLYGAVIGAAAYRKRRAKALLSLVIMHLLSALVCILIANEAFASVG